MIYIKQNKTNLRKQTGNVKEDTARKICDEHVKKGPLAIYIDKRRVGKDKTQCKTGVQASKTRMDTKMHCVLSFNYNRVKLQK